MRIKFEEQLKLEFRKYTNGKNERKTKEKRKKSVDFLKKCDIL